MHQSKITDTEQSNTMKLVSPFIFNICNDVDKMRFFYTELLGFQELGYKKGAFVDYKFKETTIMFSAKEDIFSDMKSYSDRHQNGSEPISWSIEVEEDLFPELLNKLCKSGVKTLQKVPAWNHDGFWSFSVLDPMGNNIQIYMEPKNITVVSMAQKREQKKVARFKKTGYLKKIYDLSSKWIFERI
jgi:hypothetical protein